MQPPLDYQQKAAIKIFMRPASYLQIMIGTGNLEKIV